MTHQVGFPEGCDSLLERCVHIMHTVDPIEKADLTLLLGQQWRTSIPARDNTSDTCLPGERTVMKIGRATPPDIPSRPDNLEFVRPGFGVKVGKAGSICMSMTTFCFHVSCMNEKTN